MKNKFRIALLSMAAVGLVGCADKLAEDITQDPGGYGTADGFVSFKISNIGSETRAASERTGADKGYATGSENEYKITIEQGANVVFFFNSEGASLGKSYLQLMSETADDGDDSHNYPDNVTEKVYSARVKKSKDAENIPAYCVLILNAKPSSLEELASQELNLNGLMTQIDETDLGQYGDYFTMSNTVYVSNTDKKLQGPKDIDAGNICDTWEKAKEKPVTVHVERIVAKFGLTFEKEGTSILETGNIIKIGSDESITDETSEEQKEAIGEKKEKNLPIMTAEGKDGSSSWGIRIIGWDVNAKETKTYWLKNLNDGNNFGNTTTSVYPNGTLSTETFGNWGFAYTADSKGWNDESRVRSYWAVDPHYNDDTNDKYPQQYREAKNPEVGETILSGSTTGTNFALKYITYNEISKGLKVDENTPKYLYAPENTFGKYSFIEENKGTGVTDQNQYEYKGNGFKRASTHILISAELLIGDEVTNSEGTVADKYCYEGVYWCGSAVLGEGNSKLITHMVNNLLDYHASPVYKEDGSQFTADDAATYFELVDATIKGGDGRQMLSLISGKKLYNQDATVTESRTEVNLASKIYEVGTVKHFNKGAMYYAIPIEHMVAKNDTKNSDGTLSYKWNTGSYGVVRNHWYNVNVSAIANPGTSVDKTDQPIIPNDEPDEGAYIAFEIVVIPWHVINQEIEF